MSINKQYGMDHRVINLVKNELQKDRGQSCKSIFEKAKQMLPDIDFDIIGISDLIHHLPEPKL